MRKFLLLVILSISCTANAGICDRSYGVVEAIQWIVQKTCDRITARDLASIGELHLRHMDSIQTSDLAGLTGLSKLDLGQNEFTTLPEDLFQNLPSLTYIEIYITEISSLPRGIFRGLCNVTDMRLDGNELTALPEGLFSDMTSLEFLTLGYNGLRTLPLGIFRGLNSLKNLSLDKNALVDLPPGLFNHLPSLEYLDLRESAPGLSSAQFRAKIRAIKDALPNVDIIY